MVIEAIRSKVIEFCQKTRFWRAELDGFYTITDDEEYEIDVPSDSTVADILVIKVNNNELTPKTQDEVEELYSPSSDWRESSGIPRYFFLRNPSIAVFVPIPNAAYPIRITVALKPTQAAQGVDEIIFEEHKDTIVHGVLAYLMQMPEKTWSNPNLSVFHDGKFESESLKAKRKAAHGYALRKTWRVKAHNF